MNSEDKIYIYVLIVSLGIGYVFQNITNTSHKKWLSTVIGFVILILVSKLYVLHFIFLTFFVGCVIRSNRRYCHIISFIMSFSYLVFFRSVHYLGIPSPSGHANMIQMILTLKLVGLAFEVHDNYEIKKKLKDEDTDVMDVDRYKDFPDPKLLDVFHYSLCYAGVLTGPYYTYRTYLDMFLYNKSEYKLCFKAAIKTISYVPLYVLLYLLTSWSFPIERLYSEEFYTNTSYFYRLWYMYPTFFIFRMRMYIAFKLSEAVCIMAGIGMYPCATNPKLGSGPSTNFEELEKQSTEIEDYNFETICSVHVYHCEFSYTVREAVRHWNRSVQYWLATYVYHRFSYKPLRTLVTFFVSSFWHGVHAGYYFSLFSVPLYLLVEDTFQKKIMRNNKSKLRNFFLWNAKMFQFSYWGLAFQVKNCSDVWRYGQSVYFMPYIVASCMYLLALIL